MVTEPRCGFCGSAQGYADNLDSSQRKLVNELVESLSSALDKRYLASSRQIKLAALILPTGLLSLIVGIAGLLGQLLSGLLLSILLLPGMVFYFRYRMKAEDYGRLGVQRYLRSSAFAKAAWKLEKAGLTWADFDQAIMEASAQSEIGEYSPVVSLVYEPDRARYL